ncbi:MAG: hypothetical protein DLM60_07595 [Pseudonocardiales bacterium]|nr:MAG: hypothetical protein DLM60_07595 [Pseudonocardiales bacterium]
MEVVLDAVGRRLKRIRQQRKCTLAALSVTTGISVSTLSRLECGQRKPSLELLLPIAHSHQMPLDELVGAPPVGDPRVRLKPVERKDSTMVPLTQQPGGLQAFKMIIGITRSEPSTSLRPDFRQRISVMSQKSPRADAGPAARRRLNAPW